MNETKALTQVKTSVTPPLTKREVIALTAIAMHDEQLRVAREAMKQQEELEKLARAAAKKLVLKLCRNRHTQFGRIEFCSNWRGGKTEDRIAFSVYVDFRELPEYQAWQNFKVPHVQETAAIRRDLERCGRPGRLSKAEILDLAGVREKLLELGKQALGIAEAKKPGAIEVAGA